MGGLSTTAVEALPDPDDMHRIREWLNAGEPPLRSPGGAIKSLFQWASRQALQLHGGGESRSSLPPIALHDIAAERQRQVSAEGWTPDHDDEHGYGELAQAAACYADPLRLHTKTVPTDYMVNGRAQAGDAEGWPIGPDVDVPVLWPWLGKWWRPDTRRRELVKAGALIVAEIERLDRTNPPQQASTGGGELKTASNPILQGPTREEVARIVEPSAFKTLREIASARGLDVDSAPAGVCLGPIDTWRPERAASREVAFAKADQILALLNPTSPWRPIESAPLDGTAIIAWGPGQFVRVYTRFAWGWGKIDTQASPMFPLTHWMPLPALPGGSE